MDDLHVIKWYVDSDFSTHVDFKSHTGGIMTYGRRLLILWSIKNKLNTRSIRNSELVGAENMSIMILWRKYLWKQKGSTSIRIFSIKTTRVKYYWKEIEMSSIKRTISINIIYLFMMDNTEKWNIEVDYCPTEELISDFMRKPLQGKRFKFLGN